MKRIYTAVFTAILMIFLLGGTYRLGNAYRYAEKTLCVGFIYDSDESAPHSYNFMRAQYALQDKYGEKVQVMAKTNVQADNAEQAIHDLITAGCNMIFSTSADFEKGTKEMARLHQNIQFCQAMGDNANEEPIRKNYHTFMGEIYQGRYISGIVAGMKLKEMIDSGEIDKLEAKIGYVASYESAAVISGYTAFLLGVRSVVPYATMKVKYTNARADYKLEKAYTKELIDRGCVIISQHSDSIGPAAACEEVWGRPVYHVGYNRSTVGIAPATSLISTRINWEPYILGAVEAVLRDEKIEDYVDGSVHGNDMGAGFDRGWIEMLELNTMLAARGTKEKINETVEAFRRGSITVFRGNYIGRNPFDESDLCNLRYGYEENKNSSAPTFYYVLEDVITVVQSKRVGKNKEYTIRLQAP